MDNGVITVGHLFAKIGQLQVENDALTMRLDELSKDTGNSADVDSAEADLEDVVAEP